MRPSAKRAASWIVAGGLAYWLPYLVVEMAAPSQDSVWAINLVPVAGLVVLAAVTWLRRRRAPSWGWVLAGIYILGPSAMLLAARLSTPPASGVPGQWLMLTLICLFPPMTLWLATLNGAIFSLLIVSAVLGGWLGYRSDRGPAS